MVVFLAQPPINKAIPAKAMKYIGLGILNFMIFVFIVMFLYYTFETGFSSLLSEILPESTV
ncbi:hypothetical protein DWW00_18780 [Bacteroides fragilis]|uniref:Transmembrane protein n=1 Tax=Bacteroides fragilis TaxID=817 RepID=A0A412YGU5_BACFG|nr:hypothetical protein DWW08_06605 [Bacteroides fragilis]RGV83208.1 hypothetical protein DWW00_18780 [Bacteroides fragilis]